MVRICHFQDGGNVTNPVGLSLCILQKGSNVPIPGQTLATKVNKSHAIPQYVPGVSPTGWPLISELNHVNNITLLLS